MVTPLYVLHAHRETIARAVAELEVDREVVIWTEARELVAALGDVELLLASAPPRVDWGAASRLRLVHLAGVGAEQLLPAKDLRAQVRIACARGLFAAEVAEHVVAVMLALVRGLPQLHARQRARTWRRDEVDRVAGKTLGLLGLGAIGRRVARVARALDMRVVATRRSGLSDPAADLVLPPARLDELLAGADVVVVALPSTPETRGLLDARALATCRPDAVLINVARGGIVDEPALLRALEQGRLAAAALDVFEHEPLPQDSPLWHAPNLLVTPHAAGLGRDYAVRLLARVLDNVARLESGAELLGEVDRARGY